MSINVIEMYNSFVPFMNELQDSGHFVIDRKSKYAGHGFVVEGNNEYYVDVTIFFDNVSVVLNRHNKKNSYDVLNDTEIMRDSATSFEKVKELVLDYLEQTKHSPKVYSVPLTEEELNKIIKVVDNNIAIKLRNYMR